MAKMRKTTRAKKKTTPKKIARKAASAKKIPERQVKIGDIIECPDCGGTGSASHKYVTGAGPTLADIGRSGLRCVRCSGTGKLEKVTETGSLQPYRKTMKIKMKWPPK